MISLLSQSHETQSTYNSRKMNINEVREYITHKLKTSLSPTLTYHGYHHTFDVLKACKMLALAEGIDDEESLILLETAALYHDLGFITTYKGHEEEGCRIAKKSLPDFNYSPDQIEKICGMIMATKIPQSPKNNLEEILADADLDYLGREDFGHISHTLFKEMLEREMIENIEQWNRIQVDFLSGHHYWTKSAIRLRNDEKQNRLAELKAIVDTY